MLQILFLIFVLLFGLRTHAFILDANVFYFSDTFNTGTATTKTTTAYDLRFGFGVDKKGRFFAGWNYSGVTVAEQVTGGSDQYVSTEMGPSFLWALNKDRTWVLSATYNIVSSATYTPAGSTPEKWKGTTIKVYLGYTFEFSEGWFFGPTLNYYAATFSEKIVNETTYSQSSNGRSTIYPALYFGHRY